MKPQASMLALYESRQMMHVPSTDTWPAVKNTNRSSTMLDGPMLPISPALTLLGVNYLPHLMWLYFSTPQPVLDAADKLAADHRGLVASVSDLARTLETCFVGFYANERMRYKHVAGKATEETRQARAKVISTVLTAKSIYNRHPVGFL
jgi:hypothetical protein